MKELNSKLLHMMLEKLIDEADSKDSDAVFAIEKDPEDCDMSSKVDSLHEDDEDGDDLLKLFGKKE